MTRTKTTTACTCDAAPAEIGGASHRPGCGEAETTTATTEEAARVINEVLGGDMDNHARIAAHRLADAGLLATARTREEVARALYLHDRDDITPPGFGERMWDEGHADGDVRQKYLGYAQALADAGLLLATARTRPTRYEVARAIRLSRTNGLCKPGVRCDLCDCAQEYEDDLALRDADAVLALLDGGEQR